MKTSISGRSTSRVPGLKAGAVMALAVMASVGCADGVGPVAPGELDALSGPSQPRGASAALSMAAANMPVEVRFDKQFRPDLSTETFYVWTGVVEGGVSGTLVSSIDLTAPGTMEAGQTLHATIRWEVDAGSDSFVAETSGIVNGANSIVRSNGGVTEGWRAGSQVHQEGELTGLDAVGFLRVQRGGGG